MKKLAFVYCVIFILFNCILNISSKDIYYPKVHKEIIADYMYTRNISSSNIQVLSDFKCNYSKTYKKFSCRLTVKKYGIIMVSNCFIKSHYSIHCQIYLKG